MGRSCLLLRRPVQVLQVWGQPSLEPQLLPALAVMQEPFLLFWLVAERQELLLPVTRVLLRATVALTLAQAARVRCCSKPARQRRSPAPHLEGALPSPALPSRGATFPFHSRLVGARILPGEAALLAQKPEPEPEPGPAPEMPEMAAFVLRISGLTGARRSAAPPPLPQLHRSPLLLKANKQKISLATYCPLSPKKPFVRRATLPGRRDVASAFRRKGGYSVIAPGKKAEIHPPASKIARNPWRYVGYASCTPSSVFMRALETRLLSE